MLPNVLTQNDHLVLLGRAHICPRSQQDLAKGVDCLPTKGVSQYRSNSSGTSTAGQLQAVARSMHFHAPAYLWHPMPFLLQFRLPPRAEEATGV